ncbi:MAG: hypothetical protein WBK91_09670 [Alphaproteobacteria bacterium]
MLALLFGAQYSSAQTPSDSGQPMRMRHVSVPAPDGKKVDKANIFIGNVDENITHAIGNSSSFNKLIYGENYLAAYDQQHAIKDMILLLPKDWPVNLIGHGLGGATAAAIAVELHNTRPINMLTTIDPRGALPDLAVVKNGSK